MKNLSLLIILLGFLGSAVTAQTQTLRGKVTDAQDGSPVAGATVKETGGKVSVITGSDGSFTISVSSAAKELTISFIGFTDKQVPVTDPLNDIRLTQSAQTLNDVVVVGYGTSTKRNITGSVVKVGSRDLENFPAPSFESAIQGKAAGVVVESGSGKLGQAIKIRIRGTSSISASSQPLYVIDGLPLDNTSQSDASNEPTNPLTDINPNDIESIEILKDASAAAIYGARGANGVVLITTKKGKGNQKTVFTLDANTGWSNPARKRPFLDANGYVKLVEIAQQSDATYGANIGDFASYEEALDYFKTNIYEGYVLDKFSQGTDWRTGAVNTNWQNLLFNKNAPNSQVNLSASGGSDKTHFFVSGFYGDQQAIVINNRFYRYGGRLNLEHQATSNLTIGMNLAVNRSQLNRVTNDNAFSSPGQLVAQLPINPAYDSTGQPNTNTLYPSGLLDAKYNTDIQVTYRTIGNAYANLTIIPSLTFRSEFGADINTLREEAFQGKESQDGGGIGRSSIIQSQVANFNTNNYFTYAPKLKGNSKLDAVVGMSYQQNNTVNSSAFGEGIPSDAIKNLAGTTTITSATSQGYKYTFLSYFLRANYALAGKYLLTGSIRTDASSRFGSNNRYGWFPAVSAGWLLSEENFLKNSSFVNTLKLRASYGLTGNAEIGESNFLALYGVSNYPNLPGYVPVSLANPDLKWEKTLQVDAGLEFGLFKSNRIYGEVDVYRKHTSDLLLSVNVPSSTGYNSFLKNLGTMRNQGIEATINTVNINGKFRWVTSINAAYNQNKVLNITGQIIEGGFGLPQRAVEGEPIGVFYGQKFLGVDPQTGDAQYADDDGKPTTDYNAAARVVLGKSNPDWTGGFTNTFSYKGIDLSVFFNFVTGNKVYNAAGVYQSDGFYNGFDNQTTDVLKAWQKPGDVTNVPRIGYFYASGYQNSSRWLYDGSYLRLRNLTLGYSLPKSVVQKFNISSFRFYVSGVNLLTVTKYPGDPEVNTQTIGNIGGGQDFYTIPQAKTITAGISVRF